MARKRRNYTDELKKKIVELYNSGKPRAELVREYELTPSALSSWIMRKASIIISWGKRLKPGTAVSAGTILTTIM